MITLRTLKKKSKQAQAILIEHYGYKPERFFLAERGDNYHGLNIRCDHLRKPGRFRCDCQSHPLPHTPMTGEVSGYEEPEWDERTALEELRKKVDWEPRPASLSDKAWRRVLTISGTKPVTQADLDMWFADLDDASEDID
ncbi:hypothetical protein [Bosea sp. (in: a-proteobacteria)]|uniref:hypothetical protein n=1 Tax=Bosea sp. (in: a-proteobacteria) TaxID=1871050 RepID=UPI003B3B8FA2